MENPRQKGKALVGELKGMWRYRIGNYRVICEIQDKQVMILVVEIDHHSKRFINRISEEF